MNGYNFTERVRKVLAMAREESARLHHEYVGTEHILLGLIREGAGVGATVLQNLGVDLDELKAAIELGVKKGKADTTGPDLPYTSRAKKVLELAMKQARELNHSYVGTEHLLLGLIDESNGIAAQVLSSHGVTLEKASVETVNVLGSERAPSEGESRVRRRFARQATSERHPTMNDSLAVHSPAISDRIKDVMRDAEDVAAACGSPDLMPIHVAISLLRHGEGFANAMLDRLTIDRPALVQSLMNEAARSAQTDAGAEINFGQYMVAFQRQVESEARWRQSPASTLHVLLALLDNVKPVATIFDAQGINAERVRNEARRMSG